MKLLTGKRDFSKRYLFKCWAGILSLLLILLDFHTRERAPGAKWKMAGSILPVGHAQWRDSMVSSPVFSESVTDSSSSFVSMSAAGTQINSIVTSWRLDECCTNYLVGGASNCEMMSGVASSAACSLVSLHLNVPMKKERIFILSGTFRLRTSHRNVLVLLPLTLPVRFDCIVLQARFTKLSPPNLLEIVQSWWIPSVCEMIWSLDEHKLPTESYSICAGFIHKS